MPQKQGHLSTVHRTELPLLVRVGPTQCESPKSILQVHTSHPHESSQLAIVADSRVVTTLVLVVYKDTLFIMSQRILKHINLVDSVSLQVPSDSIYDRKNIMDCVGPACQLMQCEWPTLAHRISYVRDLTKNLKKLTDGIEELCSIKDDLNAKINKEIPFKVPSNECRAWIEKLEKLENQVSLLKTEIGSNRRCFNIGCCFPDLYSRMKMGKRIMTSLDEVTGLKEASGFKGQDLVDAQLTVVQNLAMAPITANKESIDRIVQNLSECMREENNQKIGLWGMGGVGKTTVMKNFNNRPEITQSFEIVIWVTVSKEWTVRKLQNEVANRLQMNVNDRESDESVARGLDLKLRTMKYLLLLDDIWSQVDLLAIGIPSPNKEIGSKIVMTFRSADVCNKMETDVDIKVNVLTQEEAWNLFCEKVGEVVRSPKIDPIAREIVKQCAGLPLAILVVGGSLRKEVDTHVWKNFLDELRSASFGCGDMEESVFQQLKFSYDRLKNDNVKNCFLYCALYPEDEEIPVDELVELWRAEGFINSMKTLDKAYNKGHTIINSLIKDSLLERCEKGVKMHDMVRDLALRLTSLNEAGRKFLVRAGEEDECGNAEKWDEAERIFLIITKTCDLPGSPRCNSLSTLLLRIPWGVKQNIPSLFFQHMHNLRVLQLRQGRGGMGALPSSISSLVNLRGLYILCHYDLVILPSEIGNLKRLEVLFVTVGSLPLEVKQLTSLRSLHIKFWSVEGMRTMCSQGVISSLHLLEDLRLGFPYWDLLDEWYEISGMIIAEELSSLKHLANLHCAFSTTECLEHFLIQRERNNCPQLRDFLISVAASDYFNKLADYEEKKGKILKWHYGEKASEGEIIKLLSQAYNLRLGDHKTAHGLLDFGLENINKLEVCRVEKCTAMKTILGGSGSSRNEVLPNLHELDLQELPMLRSIFDPPHVFKKLTKLIINKLPKLRYIFTRVMIQQMSNLEMLQIWACEEMEEIVANEEENEISDDDVRVFFPRFNRLELRSNPKLVRIWKGVSQPWPSLGTIYCLQCPNLTTLNLKVIDNLSVLRKIYGEKEWWEALEWEDDHDKPLLQPLFIRADESDSDGEQS